MQKLLLLIGLVCLNGITVLAQSWTFSRKDVDFVIELPSTNWRAVSRVDVHDHVEFINGDDDRNGYLQISKMLVSSGTTPVELFHFEEKWRLQQLPGYVICGDCNGNEFRGQLSGASFSYEYVSAGKVMAGRIYYLQLDNRTFYSLRFTASQAKLRTIRTQMDQMAQSFRLK